MKKPCGTPWKIASEEIQWHYIHRIENSIKNAENNNNIVLFCDASHIIHNTLIRSLRQNKWEKYTMKIQMNSWRDRRNILWTMRVWSNEVFAKTFCWSCNSESFVEYLYELRDYYKDKSYIDIYLDNARYQKTQLVRETAKVLKIRLHYLPPYTPNLNLIEKLWKWLKWKLANVYHESSLCLYETICDLLRKTKTEFRDEILKISKSRIRILNFI